ncbi:MAG: YicC family protein [Clostridiales bacterium]|nr:YicC family protein [Clostridiales bacterium]
MQSMTGYGRYRVCRDGRELTIELKAVNHRFLDLSFRIPRNISFLEDVLRSSLNQGELSRGHVDVFVTYQNMRMDTRNVQIDVALLGAFNQALKTAKNELQDYKRPVATDVLSLSGALQIAQADEDVDEVTALANEAISGALAELTMMRSREGEHLANDLLGRLLELAQLRERVLVKAPAVPQEYRSRLTSRLEEWELHAVDAQRVAQEVAIMADRCAIDEELSRLESHITQFERIIKQEAEVGRKLDFLLQEMNREVNTIGSKASDAEIAQIVVDAKCVIEKLREQVQNAV